MLAQLKGLKITILSLAGASLIFWLLIQYHPLWQPLEHVVLNVLYSLLVITIIFAAQFNHSRISLLAILWLLFIISKQHSMPWSHWLNQQGEWMILTGISLMALIALIQDRGLLSFHGIIRIVLIVLCGLGAYGWLWLSTYLQHRLGQNPLLSQYVSQFTLPLPIAVSALIIVWQSLSKATLLLGGLAVNFSVWCLQYYYPLPLAWDIIIIFFIIHYLLVVIIDSYFLAYRDELTGLPSRRALNQLALSLGRKYTVAMLDIDHFKKFNDTYGHDIGDQVLRLAASKMAQVKKGGKVFRYGGEEFTVVFPRKDLKESMIELDRIRQLIAEYDMFVRQPERKTKLGRKGKKTENMKTVSITISIGVAARASKEKFEQTLKVADQALYRAKKRGRNNVSD